MPKLKEPVILSAAKDLDVEYDARFATCTVAAVDATKKWPTRCRAGHSDCCEL
jgi:hypothetical protein